MKTRIPFSKVLLMCITAEKALVSLPSPLTAADEYIRHRDHGAEVVRVAAGLHRQVWVSGTSIFVDVHIANNSKKTIRKLELALERDILCYKHAAASTLEKSAGQARIFDSNDRTIVSKNAFKQGGSWNGVPAHSTDVRTYDLELPRGHATVKCGKYFEVRYFLNITASSSHSKLVSIQLPIILIHNNSLDVVPNSVNQVAAAIEEKRATTRAQGHKSEITEGGRITRQLSSGSRSVQGRAFAAPRMQSLERMRQAEEELKQLGQILDSSPRRHQKPQAPSAGAALVTQEQMKTVRLVGSFEYHTPPSNRKGRVLLDDDVAEIRRRLQHVRSTETLRTARSTKISGSRRSHSLRRRFGGASSAMGFRSAEMEADVGPGRNSNDGRRSEMSGSVRSRVDAGRLRGKMRKEGWRGWVKGVVKPEGNWI